MIINVTLALLVSWPVTLAALGIGGATFLVLNHLIGLARRTGIAHTSALVTITTRMVDGLMGMKIIKAMAEERHLSDLFDKDISGLKKLERVLQIVGLLTQSLQELILIFGLLAGAYLLIAVWPTPIEVLIILAVLFARTVSSANRIQKTYQDMAGREASYWLVHRLAGKAEANAEEGSGNVKVDIKDSITFEDVTMGYSGIPILSHANFTIPAKGLTTVVGPSGIGKTTLIDIVMGLIHAQEGRVNIDTVNIDECDLNYWRSQIGYLPQEPHLFHGSVAYNVSMEHPDIGPEHIRDALNAAEILEDITSLEAGVETDVGERGLRFSGGQRQRIALARALARRPRLIILDEATAALDRATSASICQTLRQLSKTYPVLAVTHDPLLEDAADTVLTISDGKVVTQRSNA